MHAVAQAIPIHYCSDSVEWFVKIRTLAQPIWLDSARPHSQYGQWDILSAAPSVLLETCGDITHIRANGQDQISSANPFEILSKFLPAQQPTLSESPFCGGALGYFGYDLGRRLEKLPELAARDIDLPDMCVGIYPWAIVQNHATQQAWLIINEAIAPVYDFSFIRRMCTENDHKTDRNNLKQFLNFKENPFNINSFDSNVNVDEYRAAVQKTQDYIAAGDCYQVNIAQRFQAQYAGDTFQAYLQLRESLPSPFSAYMEFAQGALLSLSPERFIQLRSNLAETKPIKGTIARGKDPIEDAENAAQLLASQKDRAENLMIVDLLRNDFSKTCSQVQVPELFGLQSFANVHHLVSTVTGQLNEDESAISLLSSCFPGGSITGAPKIRAMEIIEELEPVRRSIYCGSVGYVSACGNMDTSIAIRTLVCDKKNMYCWGGGGIVADSNADTEYAETITKVNLLLTTLEQHFLKKT